ncbi:MAG TPA: type II toxin-antitoxin system VapB family antitoxin [Opitutaceae bacterium]
MPTNLQIDDRLLEAAQRVGGFKTKKDTVNHALEDFVRRRDQVRVFELFGAINLHEKFDPKQLRKKR